jgi:flagellar motor switch protein FliM
MIRDSKLAAVPKEPAGARAAYDVCMPGMIPRHQMALLETIHSKFLQSWAAELGAQLRTPVAGEHRQFRPMLCSDFLAEYGRAGCLVTLDVHPPPGKVILALPAGLLLRVVASLIGAPADEVSSGRTSLTTIEMHILREFFENLIRSFGAPWSAYHAAFRLKEIQAAGSSNGGGDTESMVVLESSLRFGEDEELLRAAIPPLMVRLAANEGRQQPGANQSSVRDDLRAALGTAKVELEAVLAGSSMRISDVLALQPGEIVMLAQPVNARLECRINGLLKFRGELIHSRERAALMLEDMCRPTEGPVGPRSRYPAPPCEKGD